MPPTIFIDKGERTLDVADRYFWEVVEMLAAREFLSGDTPVLDVRSPGEFTRGHIPGAHSMPLFTDEERAVVGTLYKQKGRDTAMLQGLRFVGPRLAEMVEHARQLAPAGSVRIHCWRGGERSGSVAWLLAKAGMDVTVLKGGYKAFRNHVLAGFAAPLELRVLGGHTGSGKTMVLQELQRLGVGVIDLEQLAGHKGSAFGGIGKGTQPTTEHFENLLWHHLSRAVPAAPFWVEDESLMIGSVKLPVEFHRQLRRSPLLFLDVPLQHRVARLVKEYGELDREQLAAAISRIGRRLGPQHTKSALEALAAGDMEQVATIVLHYYDKAYLRGLSEREAGSIQHLAVDHTDARELAMILGKHVTTTI